MATFLKICIFKLVESNLKNANQIRCYARWSHRRPRRVLAPEEYDKIEAKYEQNSKMNVGESSDVADKVIELNSKTDLIRERPKINQSKRKWIPKNLESQGLINMTELDVKSDAIHYKIEPKMFKKKKPVYKTKSSNTETATDMLETVIDANGEFIYTKLKDNDPTIGQLLLTVKSRSEQVKKDLALLEGKRLIKEALEGQCTLKSLIFSRKGDVEYLKPFLPKSGAKLYKMPYREIQMWSDLTTAPGIMGIFKTPAIENFVPKNSLELTIICDNVREPGNLGSILRTAAGVGAQSVILTKGCVDLWDTKVLRSACGAHFHLQIHKKMNWPDIKKHLNDSSTILIADNKIITENFSVLTQNEEKSLLSQEPCDKIRSLRDIVVSMPLLPYYGVKFGRLGHLVLIVGGETEGICEESYRLAADFNGIRLNIPLSNNVDSLNTGTALGIIMFEIKRQMALLNHNKEVESLIQ